MEYTLDTIPSEILDDRQAQAVLDEPRPGVADNPTVGMARGMVLNTLLSMPQAQQIGLTKDKPSHSWRRSTSVPERSVVIEARKVTSAP